MKTVHIVALALLATSLGAQQKEAGKGVFTQTAVLAGGCFWGVEAVFEHTKGVVDVVSGYAGGAADQAKYEVVGTGRTRHAESVRITYDPSQVSYEQLLKIFFSVAHDPTQLNRQGPDIGPQYRSAIFFANAAQETAARKVISDLSNSHTFRKPIVTEVAPLQSFFMAERYHQDFARLNPEHPYIVYHDLPKLTALRQSFPDWYVAK